MSTVDQVLSHTDPGDDMQRRLRYQAGCGALYCLDLLGSEEISELFCEHHEDFLIKRKAGDYIGVQVKTRLPGAGPFKTSDEPVRNAFERFVGLEIEFPNCFARFLLVANCDFYAVGSEETNLSYVLEQLRARPSHSFKGAMKTLIASLRSAHGCKKEVVLKVLSKVYLEGTVPKFEDMVSAVTSKIGKLRPDIQDYRSLEACATTLIERVLQASALPCDQPLRTHFLFASSPNGAKAQATIQQKRIDQAFVVELFAISVQTLLVAPTNGNVIELHTPAGTHRLEKKMAAGGISAPSVILAKDHQASAEFVLQQWIGRYGPEAAKQRRDHIDLAVRTRCTEAQDITANPDKPYGASMLSATRAALKELAEDKEHVFGLKYEQLLGFVSLATQACRIWWSDPFPLDDVNGTV